MFFDTSVLHRPTFGRLTAALAAAALFTTPAAAHGTTERTVGIAFPTVVAGAVAASLLGGGLVLAATERRPRSHGVVPLLVLSLGGLSVALAVDVAAGAVIGAVAGVGVVVLTSGHGLTDCGACADAALGAVTLHRGLEGVVLATVYAADAALGLLGAAVLAVHATAETAAVGSLYDASRRHALGAVCLLQAGFVVGVVSGLGVVDAVPPFAEAGVLALVGGVLLAAGARETYARHVVSASTTTA
jgi:hypothetical protein